MSIQPRLSFTASSAGPHDAGLPILIAVATVRGSAITRFSYMGAAPAAWKPTIRGRLPILPSRWYSR
jgi:hypothetical protein